MKRLLLPLVVLAVCLTSSFAQRPGDFRILGPGGGGAMFHPLISPHDTNTVLIACDMTGAYITHDGGKTWRMFNLRGVVNFFVFDPKDPKTMYAHATGLWRSTDAGEHWSLVYPNPSAVKGVKMNSDHADETILADPDPLAEISAMAIDPDNPDLFYAAAGPKDSTALFISKDQGKSWDKKFDLPAKPRNIWVDPHSAADARTLYLADDHVLMVTAASGARSLPLPSGVNSVSMGFGSAAQPTLYAASSEAPFVSIDGGANWKKSQLPGSSAKVRAIATSLHHPEIA